MEHKGLTSLKRGAASFSKSGQGGEKLSEVRPDSLFLPEIGSKDRCWEKGEGSWQTEENQDDATGLWSGAETQQVLDTLIYKGTFLTLISPETTW